MTTGNGNSLAVSFEDQPENYMETTKNLNYSMIKLQTLYDASERGIQAKYGEHLKALKNRMITHCK